MAKKKVKDYVVISELPKEQQEPLTKWLFGQTCPVIEEEGENKYNCCYKCDYESWFESWSKGKTANIYD